MLVCLRLPLAGYASHNDARPGCLAWPREIDLLDLEGSERIITANTKQIHLDFGRHEVDESAL